MIATARALPAGDARHCALITDPVITSMIDAEIRYLRRDRFLRSEPEDDLRQAMAEKLIVRLRSHLPERGALRAWFRPVIRSAGDDLRRHARRCRRTPPGPITSLDQTAFNESESVSVGDLIPAVGEEPLEQLIAVERHERVGQVIASLTPHLRELCGVLSEKSKEEARTRLQRSRRHFNRDIEDLKQVFGLAGLAPDRPDCAHASRN